MLQDFSDYVFVRLDMGASRFAERLLSLKPDEETQGAFLRRLKISLKTFNNWRNDRTSPSLATVETIAGMLDVPPEWLAFGIKAIRRDNL